MKHIPNIFTLGNLFFGCLAIVCIMQPGLTIAVDGNGENLVTLPEKIWMSALFIVLAAVIDFLDGFVARLLNVPSEMGKQLDSLADVVSFGVAPGLIVFQFLRLSFAQQPDGLDTNIFWLLPAFILPCAGAYRLARFNTDTSQYKGFRGVPIPAVGLLFASFPLIYWYTSHIWMVNLLLNKWFWYATVLAASYLMVSTLPMMALKFQGTFSMKKILPFLALALVGLSAGLMFHWLAVPITFIAYVILSLTFKQKES